MKTSFKLFNFVGAPVELSIWFFLIFFMAPISWSIAIFFSVLLHELAHSWIAHKRGWRVYGIKVDLFTGSANIDVNNMPETDSIPIVAAGPLSNLLLMILCFPIYIIMVDVNNPIVTKFITDLFSVNLILFVFNILPIYPMDGGRLFKDFLHLKMKNRLLAKKIAGWVSLVFSIGFLFFSIFISSIIMGVFAALFIYFSLKELEIIN